MDVVDRWDEAVKKANSVTMETLPVLENLIHKPSHYYKNEIDVHGYLEKHFPIKPNATVAEGFHIGNIIKYVSRYKEKDGLRDLEKAMDNLTVLIQLEKKRSDPLGNSVSDV